MQEQKQLGLGTEDHVGCSGIVCKRLLECRRRGINFFKSCPGAGKLGTIES